MELTIKLKRGETPISSYAKAWLVAMVMAPMGLLILQGYGSSSPSCPICCFCPPEKD